MLLPMAALGLAALTLGAPETSKVAVERPKTAVRVTPEAADLYKRGRFFWRQRTGPGFQQAADLFQDALGKDPNYAPAYAGLADTYALMSAWGLGPHRELMPKARSAAERAVELDESLAEAHTSLALIAENYDYDWPTAEREFRRAIELDPDYATAHHWYGEYLGWQGRFDEALAESDRAIELDPESRMIACDRVALFFYARRYDRAVAQARALLDRDPSYARARNIMINAYAFDGRYEEALAEIDRIWGKSDDPGGWIERAIVYGRLGRTVEAQEAIDRATRIFSYAPGDYTELIVGISAVADRKDEAIAILEKAYERRGNLMTILKVDPSLDPLRDDPRFQALLKKLRF
jgi:tetratricopeptide (TPR) repeat protein